MSAVGLTQEAIGIKYPMVPLTFTLANIAQGADGTVVPATANANYYTMPWAGSIVGMGVFLNDDVTANDYDFQPTINGTENTALQVQLDTTNPAHHEAVVPYGTINFVAGDRVGVVHDGHASATPTGTADVNVIVFVVFREVEL